MNVNWCFSKLLLGATLSTLVSIGLTTVAKAEVIPIDVGAGVSQQLGPGDAQLADDGSYFDTYTFQGKAEEQIIITMSSEELDSYLILLDAKGNSLVQDDDSGGNLDARIVYTLPSDGQYTIYANAYNSGTAGNYSLELKSATAPSPTTSTAPIPHTIPASTPVATTPASRRYFCDNSGTMPVTSARRKDGVVGVLLEWPGNATVGGLSPLQRCRQVADNLEEIQNWSGGNFAITAGRLQNLPVVCAATAPGVCDPQGLILTATSDANARSLALQIGDGITALRNAPAPQSGNNALPPEDTTPLSIPPEFNFSDALAYSFCLEDVIQLYQNPQQLQQRGRRSECLSSIFSTYANGISRSQALQIITAANQYATERLRPSILYPPRGQRVRIQELFGFTYTVDQRSQSNSPPSTPPQPVPQQPVPQ